MLVAQFIPLAGVKPALYRSIQRDWPSAPCAGDSVSLGGGDAVLRSCSTVEFTDGGVRLHFLLDPDDIQDLTDLGFEPAKS